MTRTPISALRDLLSEAGDVFRDLQEALEAGLLSAEDRKALARYTHEIKAGAEVLRAAELDT